MIDMKKEVFLRNITIINDDKLYKSLFPIPKSLDKEINYYYHLAISGKKSGEKKLQRAIKKYPRVPSLQNFLSILYVNLGKIEKAREINRKLLHKFPDYLFARINYVNQLIEKEDLEGIPEFLGKNLLLQDIYPNRKVFHITETISFLKTTLRYLIVSKQYEEAESRLLILEELGTEEDLFEITSFLALNRMDEIITPNLIQPEITPPIPFWDSITYPPKFHHNEIKWLYDYNLKELLPHIDTLMSLPRESLITDLETVLKDSIDNFEKYDQIFKNTDKEYYAVIHAILLLAELKSEQSLPYILETIKQNERYIDLNFDYFITEILYDPLYKLGQNHINELTSFLCTTGIYTYSKGAVLDALAQLYYRHKNLKKIIEEKIEHLFHCFLQAEEDDNLIDPTFIGFLIATAVDLKIKKTIPLIQYCYDREIVDTKIIKDMDEVEQGMEDSYFEIRKILPIKKWYQEI